MEVENISVKNAHDKLFKNNNNNYIFIYTPPKVGSTTLVSSLRVSLGKSYNIIHIHDEIMLSVLTGIKNVTVNELIQYISNKGKNVFVIDVYRLPIERKMSEYFEKLSCIHFNNSEQNVNNYNVKRISDRFNGLFPHLSNGEHYFNKYGIENPEPFNYEKKYTLQVVNGVNFIKLRLMDSKIWNKILSEILNAKIIILNDYKTDNKSIGELYTKFKQEYKLPANFLNIIQNCKYLNFYLSDKEKNAYFKTWEKKTIPDVTPYTDAEYCFYIRISLENQYYDDVQNEHYIDNGCFCSACSLKRKDIYFKALNGEQINEKIIHTETVKNIMNEKKNNIIKELKQKINEKNKTKKFKTNQFLIDTNNYIVKPHTK